MSSRDLAHARHSPRHYSERRQRASRSYSPDPPARRTVSREHRSRSPVRRGAAHQHHDSRRRDRPQRRSVSNSNVPVSSNVPVTLPCGAAPLSKHDFRKHEALFALYLDVQKQLVMSDLSEREVKGRWKSFVGKWYVVVVLWWWALCLGLLRVGRGGTMGEGRLCVGWETG